MDPLASDTHQIVDNNPGFSANGVLWTIRAHPSAVDVDFDRGRAEYRIGHAAMRDYGTLANALFGGGGPGQPGASIDSSVDFEVSWRNVTRTQTVRDATVGFTGVFKQTEAHIDWSMRNAAGFRFRSDSAGQKTLSAVLGRERNGVFFS